MLGRVIDLKISSDETGARVRDIAFSSPICADPKTDEAEGVVCRRPERSHPGQSQAWMD